MDFAKTLASTGKRRSATIRSGYRPSVPSHASASGAISPPPTMAPQVAKSALIASIAVGSSSITTTQAPASVERRSGAGRSGAAQRSRKMPGLGEPSRDDAKPRTARWTRIEYQYVVQQCGKATDDGKAQSHAASGIANRCRMHLVELVEDALAMGRFDADAGIDDIERDMGAHPACAEDDAAMLRVAQRVREQVAQHAFERSGIALDDEPRRHHAQCQAARQCKRRQLLDHSREERPQRDAASLRVDSCASSRERSRSCANWASSTSTVVWMLCTSGRQCASRSARGAPTSQARTPVPSSWRRS